MWVPSPSFKTLILLGFNVDRSNRNWERKWRQMRAGRYDCSQTQCYHSDTVLLNIWRKSSRSIFDCVLGCEAAVRQTRHLVSSFDVHFEDSIIHSEWWHASSLPETVERILTPAALWTHLACTDSLPLMKTCLFLFIFFTQK